jgi:hypothetical protein
MDGLDAPEDFSNKPLRQFAIFHFSLTAAEHDKVCICASPMLARRNAGEGSRIAATTSLKLRRGTDREGQMPSGISSRGYESN